MILAIVLVILIAMYPLPFIFILNLHGRVQALENQHIEGFEKLGDQLVKDPLVNLDPLLEEEQYAEVLQDSEIQQYADKEWNNMIANAQAYRCNSCRKIKRNPPEFMTKVDLEIPFLDGKLPITVYLCEVCVGPQAEH